MDQLVVAANQFIAPGKVIDIRAYGHGRVNDTFLVTLDCQTENKFILQRLNTRVFRQPELVMRNIRTFSDHVLRLLKHEPLASGRRWEVPRVLLTEDDEDHWIDSDGSFWRALSFIDQAQSFDTIQSLGHAQEVGLALAMFHSFLKDMPVEKLADTLEGFHITPRYLQHYDQVLAQKSPRKSPEVDYGLRFISQRRPWADVLEKAKEQGKLHLRPIHGDPKVNNVMIDMATRQAVSLIDLDTVKPGLVQYDIGDCLRSGCNPLGEDKEQWEAVRFETDLGQATLNGYLSLARGFLDEKDYAYLFEAIRLIPFELGLRFFTDYLEGNVYFKVGHEEQNLFRALVQFRLTESIETQETDIRAIIQDNR